MSCYCRYFQPQLCILLPLPALRLLPNRFMNRISLVELPRACSIYRLGALSSNSTFWRSWPLCHSIWGMDRFRGALFIPPLIFAILPIEYSIEWIVRMVCRRNVVRSVWFCWYARYSSHIGRTEYRNCSRLWLNERS